MAKQASHSWLTWAPESANPSSTSSRGSSQAMPSGSSLASTDENRVREVVLQGHVEHHVERRGAGFLREVDHAAADEVGVGRLGDEAPAS